MQMLSSLLIMGGLFFFADFLAEHHFRDPQAAGLLKIISLFFLGTNLIHICTSIFSATQNTKFQKGTEFIRMVATVLFTISIFFLDIGTLRIYTWAWISGIFVAILFAVYYAYRDYWRVYFQGVPIEKDTVLLKRFIYYAIPTFLTVNIGVILSQVDAQLVTFMINNEAQGHYSNYLSVLGVPFIFISPIVAFLFPVISELYTRERTERMHFLHRTFTLYFIIIAIWITAFLFQVGTPLTVLFFGETYAISGEILKYSAPFLIFNLLNQINFQFLAGTGRAWSRTVSLSIALPINILLNIIFIKMYGVAGSALAVGISWVPLYMLTWYFSREYQSLPDMKPILSNLIAVAIAIGSTAILTQLWSPPIIVLLFLAVLLYFIIFACVNYQLLKGALTIIKNNRK